MYVSKFMCYWNVLCLMFLEYQWLNITILATTLAPYAISRVGSALQSIMPAWEARGPCTYHTCKTNGGFLSGSAKKIGRGFCPALQNHGRGFVQHCKTMGGVLSTIAKPCEGFCPPLQKTMGGVLSVPRWTHTHTFSTKWAWFGRQAVYDTECLSHTSTSHRFIYFYS